MKLFIPLLALFLAQSVTAQTRMEPPPKVPTWSTTEHFNVVGSTGNEAAMRKFYGETLGLVALPDITLPPREGREFEATMFRFQVGAAELKFIVHDGLTSKPGGRDTAAGIRMISIPIKGGEALTERLVAHTGQDVTWKKSTGNSLAWVRDPDGNEVELRWYPDRAPEFRMLRLEVCITTGDLRQARDDYSNLGLLEASSAQLDGFSGLTRQFQLGDTVIRLWDPKKRLSYDTGFTKDGYGFRYIQFMVDNVGALHDAFQSNGVKILQEPTALGDRATLMFAADSDGVVIECVGPPE